MTENTRDFMKFGYRELHMAADILHAIKTINDETENVGDEVAIEFNPNSGNVFLLDEDNNVAMMSGHTLRDWYSCPQCGNEGFDGEDYSFKAHGGYCSAECGKENT